MLFYQVIHLETEEALAESYAKRLFEAGSVGVEREGGRLKAYFSDTIPLPERLKSLASLLPEAEGFRGTTIGLSDLSPLPSSFEPFELAGGVEVFPSSRFTIAERDDPGKIFLRLGPVFGTGRHETTILAAQCLWELDPPPLSLLDVGTGSGILALLAKKKGIEQVDAVEISSEALKNARENFELNGEEIPIYENVNEIGKTYEAVVANLLVPTILFLKESFLRLLKPGGVLILSGITPAEEGEVKAAFSALTPAFRKEQSPWLAFALKTPKNISN